MKTPEHIKKLKAIGACAEAVRWATQHDDAQKAWQECQRGDWMLWLLGRLSGPPESDSRKAVVLVACECARLALPEFEIRYPDDKRPRNAIETAERHSKGNASLSEVKNAAAAAYADAYDAYDAYADAYDAYDAYAAAYAAAAAAYDAYAAAYAAAAAAYEAAYARYKRLAECAEIVRKHFPKAPEINL